MSKTLPKTAVWILFLSLCLMPFEAKAQNKAVELKIGIQTFSLRHLSLEESLKVVHNLGVRYIETFEGHLNFTEPPERLEEVKKLLEKYGINLFAYGVIGLDADEKRNKKIFEFAKTMGIKVITANPELDALDVVNNFGASYDIKIAIHPHGPEYDRYPGWESVQKVIAGHHNFIGICMDVGHVTRNGEDPIEGLLNFREGLPNLRGGVYGVHLKDQDKKNRPVPLGRGRIDIGGILRTLEQTGYTGIVSLEYEPPDGVDPIPGIKESLKYIHSTLGY